MPWERTLFTHNGIDRTNRYPGAVRTPHYRLVCTIDGPQAGSQAKNRDDSRSPWMLFDMVNDPSETNDVADQHPEIVAKLSAQYETWIDGLHAEPLERWPLEIGHDEHNPVRLHASQADAVPPVAYKVGGFSNDWLTHWTSTEGAIRFPIRVVEAGGYAVELIYACPEADAGSIITVRAGDAKVSTAVPAFESEPIPMANRDEMSQDRYRVQTWGRLPVGTLSLEEGPVTLSVEADSLAGSQVMEFMGIELKKL